MSRMFLAVMLAALLVLTGSGAALAGPNVGSPITLMGKLEYVTSVATPHYEVDGYVLLNEEPALLEKFAGEDVVVVGTPSSEPSIFMRKTLQVTSITAKPADNPPAPGDGPVVTIPVIPNPVQPALPAPTLPAPIPAQPSPAPAPVLPDPAPVVPVIQPAPAPTQPAPEPIHLFGSPYYVLFGRVDAKGDTYLLTQATATGTVTFQICSTALDLSKLVGQQVGLVVARDTGKDLCYRVISAVLLTADLAPQVKSGDGPIYTAPVHPISIRLHGQTVTMDQAPIVGNGRTLVPLRAIGEGLGARVSWDPATETASVTLGDREVRVTVGSNLVVMRAPGRPDTVIPCDIAPVVASGRTLVPVRVISEGLGLSVDWDDVTSTVILN